MSEDDVFEFKGKHRFLSNFWPAKVSYDGVEYPSVENAYVASKFEGTPPSQLQTCPPVQAKSLGKTASPTASWHDYKVRIMEDLVRQKFSLSSTMKKQLLQTYPGELIEGNSWGDTFWGKCKGIGQNQLGKILMKVRAELMGENNSV